VRLLYLLTHAGLFRNFESTLEELVDRGHVVHVAFDSDRYPSAAFETLLATSPNLSAGRTPAIAAGRWQALGRAVRAGSDYIRYLDPRYADASKLRERAWRQVPIWLRWPLRAKGRLARIDRSLRAIEGSLPLDPAALVFVRDQRPDLVVVSPLFGSVAQLEILRAARALGVPTCLTVASWDNLTNKGLIREVPGTVVVWNEAQLTEAVELHGVPAERVRVSGAQNFDEWFARAPSSTAGEFIKRLGLDPERPYLLYLGSSSFIAPEEAAFAVEWLRRLRAVDHEQLKGIGVLFRPHPQNARQWYRPELDADPQVVVYPPPASAPQQTGRADWSREDFYDSMHHAAAVIGVNTTAMIESAVLGRSVHTMLASRFRDAQEGTLHFEHLREFNGGLLHLTEEFDSHFAGLARAVGDGRHDARSRRFVKGFVRPHGLELPATPLVVEALEAAVNVPAVPSDPARPRAAVDVLAYMALAADRVTAGAWRQRKRRAQRRVAKVLRRLRASD
jgi:hypothetical protein